jgi:hypothetical protein
LTESLVRGKLTESLVRGKLTESLVRGKLTEAAVPGADQAAEEKKGREEAHAREAHHLTGFSESQLIS